MEIHQIAFAIFLKKLELAPLKPDKVASIADQSFTAAEIFLKVAADRGHSLEFAANKFANILNETLLSPLRDFLSNVDPDTSQINVDDPRPEKEQGVDVGAKTRRKNK